MKYKSLTKNQIIISIDRLTRFKTTEEKYLRVFKDIIVSNLVEPKLKKSEIEKLNYSRIKDIAEEIFNNSLKKSYENDFSINKKLKDYENNVFQNNQETQELLDNALDYKSAINLLSDYDSPLPLNLEWLKILKEDINQDDFRQKMAVKFPIKKVLIVEGITEEILLPVFSQLLGYDFAKHGIMIIPAGGKNQVVKLYYQYAQSLKIPMFILLDKDAEENVKSINFRLRNKDKVYLLNSGEFEDLLPKELIVKTLNSLFKNFTSVSISEINRPQERTVKVLEEIFKEKAVHEFKKAEFANLVKEQVKNKSDISEEIIQVIKSLKTL